MRELLITAYYKDGSSKLLKGLFVRYLGYKDPILGRPHRYDTHTVLSEFELNFLLNSTARSVGTEWHSRVTITKAP